MRTLEECAEECEFEAIVARWEARKEELEVGGGEAWEADLG